MFLFRTKKLKKENEELRNKIDLLELEVEKYRARCERSNKIDEKECKVVTCSVSKRANTCIPVDLAKEYCIRDLGVDVAPYIKWQVADVDSADGRLDKHVIGKLLVLDQR